MFEKLAGRIGRRLVRYAARDSQYISHAGSEWKIAFPESEEMQDAILESILDVVAIFSLEHHSGSSAGYTIPLIGEILKFNPLSPLTGEADEWNDVGEYSGEPMWQNRRLSSVFKGADGRAYDINASPLYIDPDGCTWTQGGTRDYIEFPYTQKPRPQIHVDENEQPINPPLNPEYIESVRKTLLTRQKYFRERHRAKDAEILQDARLVIEHFQKGTQP